MEKGKCYFVESVNKYWTGRVVAITGPFSVRLEDAAWIANTGRFHQFIAGQFDASTEIEPIPSGQTVTVQWLDYIDWPHPLPREVK